MVGIILGVVALAILAAVAFGGNTGPGSEFGEPTLEGSDLPPFQSTAGDAAVGMQAPVIQGEDFSGNSVTIGEPGTPSAVVFLAHWCQHCQAEVPRVQAWLDSGGGVDGVEIVSVATSINSARPNYPPSAWLNREGWTPDILVDDTDNSGLPLLRRRRLPVLGLPELRWHRGRPQLRRTRHRHPGTVPPKPQLERK